MVALVAAGAFVILLGAVLFVLRQRFAIMHDQPRLSRAISYTLAIAVFLAFGIGAFLALSFRDVKREEINQGETRPLDCVFVLDLSSSISSSVRSQMLKIMERFSESAGDARCGVVVFDDVSAEVSAPTTDQQGFAGALFIASEQFSGGTNIGVGLARAESIWAREEYAKGVHFVLVSDLFDGVSGEYVPRAVSMAQRGAHITVIWLVGNVVYNQTVVSDVARLRAAGVDIIRIGSDDDASKIVFETERHEAVMSRTPPAASKHIPKTLLYAGLLAAFPLCFALLFPRIRWSKQ